MELKKILRQYLFSLVLLICLALLFSGVTKVREQTRYNIDMTPYETIEIKNNGESSALILSENQTVIISDFVGYFTDTVKNFLKRTSNNAF